MPSYTHQPPASAPPPSASQPSFCSGGAIRGLCCCYVYVAAAKSAAASAAVLLQLLADIRHKESVVEAFERLSGMRIQRVSTTGLVAELAWPRSLPAAAALQLPAVAAPAASSGDSAAVDSRGSSSPLQRLSAAADHPVPPTRITISWSQEETQQQQQQKQHSMTRNELRQLPQPQPIAQPAIAGGVTAGAAAAAAATAAAATAAAAAEPRTPLRQRVQIMRPCLPAGNLPCDSAVCTPLLARCRGGGFATEASVAAPAAATAAAAAAAQRQQQQQQGEIAGGTNQASSRFLPITSCKLQSRFPVLRAAAGAAAAALTAGSAAAAEALPPHKRWMYSVELLRYLLLGAVQRSLQQMLVQVSYCRRVLAAAAAAEKTTATESAVRKWLLLSMVSLLLQQGGGAGAARDPSGCLPAAAPSTAAAAPAGGLRRGADIRGLSRSAEISSSLSSADSGSSSNTAAAAAAAGEGRQRAPGSPPFPDLSTVRALLLHAHAAAGRVALLHDQLLLVLRSFTSLTDVNCPYKFIHPAAVAAAPCPAIVVAAAFSCISRSAFLLLSAMPCCCLSDEERVDGASLPHLVLRSVLAPHNDELPVLQLHLAVRLKAPSSPALSTSFFFPDDAH